MALNPKAKRRITIVLVTGALLLAVASSAYVLRKRQLAARLVRERDEGYACFVAGDYFHAMHKIGPYLRLHPTDVDALMKYGTAREKVEEEGDKQIGAAIGIFRQLLAIEPKNVAARKELLGLYVIAGYNSEILSATIKSDDDDSVRARIIAMARTGQTTEARDLALKYLERHPKDLKVQLQTLGLLEQTGTAPDQLIARAAQLQQANPQDPRFEILLAAAYAIARNSDEALRWARSAAGHSPDDAELVQACVEQLDELGDHDAANSLLDRAAAVRVDPKFHQLMVSRLYKFGKFQQVIDRTADTDRAGDQADVELLGHRALAFSALKNSAESQRVLGLLAARKDNFSAVAWARVLGALPETPSSSRDYEVIAACSDGLKSSAENPYFRLYLGDAYARIGETDAAVQEWAAAAGKARFWVAPYTRVVQAMLKSGRAGNLAGLLDQVERLAPRDAEAMGLVAVARSRGARGMSEAQRAALLDSIEAVQKIKPNEESSLGLKVMLLDVMGKSDQARATLDAALKTEPPLPQSALLGLAGASQAAKLGMEQACFERCLRAHGPSPVLAWTNALWLLRNDKSKEVLSSFDSARTSATDRDSIDWQIAFASILDEVADQRAAATWAALADANPQNLSVQERVLSAKSVRQDRDLIRRAIDRIKAVLGETGTNWRLADAQWTIQTALLEPNESERQKGVAKAAAVLNDVTRRSPDLLTARLMLADCLQELHNRDGAAEQLSAAVRLAPDSIQPVLRLAALYQSMKDYEKAKPLLEQAERILSASPLETVVGSGEPSQPAIAASQVQPRDAQGQQRADDVAIAWRNLASLYLTRGETERALAILHRLEQSKPAEARTDVARILASRGELTDDARRELLAHPTVESIDIVASSYARQGKPADAEKTLALLDQVTAQPGEKDLVYANTYQRIGNNAKAIEHARKVVAALPENAGGWRLLVTLQLLDGAGEQAVATAREAHQKLPDTAAFKQVIDQEELVRATSDAPIARPLLAALVDEGQDLAPVKLALQMIKVGRAENKATKDVANQLRPLADRNPSLTPLQNLLIDLYLRIGSYDDATAIATRLMQISPTDPTPARRACESLASAGRWSEVIPVAQQWRTRLGASPFPADTMLAMAYIAMGNPDAARKQLEPYLDRASHDPVQYADVLGLYARALVGLNRISDARALLAPTLSIDPALRSVWTQIAVQLLTEPEVAGQWLDQVDPLVPSALGEERFRMATARAQVAQRLDSPQLRSAAVTAVQKLTEAMQQTGSTDAKLWLALGVLQEMQGDDKSAEASYKRSLKLGSTDPIVPNNMAMIIVRRGGDLAEATRLAEQASQDKTNENRHEFLDTLATIQSKSGQHDAAVKSIADAIALQPKNPSPSLHAHQVEILLAAGKADEAKNAFAELERLVSSLRRPDAAMQAQVESLRAAVRAASDKK